MIPYDGKIDFDKVDINIHPAKLEVKFTGERQVFETVMYAVRNALSRGMETFAPPRAQRFIDDIKRDAPDVTVNNSGKGADIFADAFAKPAEIIRDMGTVSVPNPDSIEKIYGDEKKEHTDFDYSIPEHAKEPVPKVNDVSENDSGSDVKDFEDVKKTAGTSDVADTKKEGGPEFVAVSYESIEPMLKNVNTDYAFARKKGGASENQDEKTDSASKESDDKDSVNNGTADIGSDNNDSASNDSAEKGDKKQYTPEEISLFESMPARSRNTPDIPFREHTDIDTANELMQKVAHGITVIGEAFNSYIIVQRDSTLYLIDKHAAHERIIYESLKKGKKEGGTQLLLIPFTVNVAAEESIAISENGEYLENTGFVFEEFGTNTYLIRGVPAEIDMESAGETFVYLAGQIARAGGKAIGDIFDRALYTAACKAAVKAGTKTSKLSSTMIADILFSDEAVLYCPHGRPVLLEFTKSKLDKMFSRT